MTVKDFDFKNFISANSQKELKKMMLTHLTHFYNIKSLLSECVLKATECKVFNEKLVYFFYGRPAYRITKEQKTTRQLSFYPMCLLYDFSKIGIPHRIFPFDSGGFTHYQDFIHPSMKIDNFLLDSHQQSINDLINFFYESEFDYFDDKPSKIDLEKFSLAFEVASYYAMISNDGNIKDDQRNSAIELQYKKDISSNLLEIIIIPKQEEDSIKRLLKHYNLKCRIETYYTAGKTNPNDYYSEIKNIVRKYIN